ncbi:MAG: transglutaminase domain-containing protein [Clostridia bacterium]|nr:transglutaminase domain-containing protein [Clostridia bacterium]
MQYAEYRKKMIKLANVLSVLKRFRILIISACLVLVALVTTLLAIRGIVYEVADCPQEIVYGENLGFKAKAVMGKVVYQYSTDGGEWSETKPVRTGSYKVRPYSKDVAGKPRYGKIHEFTVLQKNIEVRAADTAVYGDDPALVADLSFNDSASCTRFDYGDKYAEKTNVLPDKDGVIITDEKGGDVTSCYVITTLESEITFNKRAITVQAVSAEKDYDGEVLTASGYELPNVGLASGDRLEIVGCEGSITDAGSAQNKIVGEIKIYNEKGDDISGRYDITKAYGALTVTPREITVTTHSATWVYDGAAHSLGGHDVTGGSLVSGHTSAVGKLTTLTDAGVKQNALTVEIFADGRKVTQNYAITYDCGNLTVTPRPVTVTADTQKIYDGTSAANGILSADNLAEGHKAYGQTSSVGVDAGERDNTITGGVVIRDAQDKDVTVNYGITLASGKITISPRPVIVRADIEKVYDDTADAEGKLVANNLVSGHYVSGRTHGAGVDAGEWANYVTGGVVIRDKEENDVTANYAITLAQGTLKITPRPVNIKTHSGEWIYDGKNHSCQTFDVQPPEQYPLPENHSALIYGWVQVNGVCETDNILTVRIYKNSGGNTTDKTANFDITYEYGTLTVKPRPITVITGSGEWVYDGKFHFTFDFEISDEKGMGLAENHTAQLLSYTSILNAGTKNNASTVYIVAGANGGYTVTSNYDITYEYGTLTVTPRPAEIVAGSAEKAYDGKALTCGTVLSSDLVNGHRVVARTIGSQTEVGESANCVSAGSVIVYDENNSNVTSNYTFTYKDGTLKVTLREVIVKAGGAQKVYDGEPLTSPVYSVISNSLTEHTLTAQTSGSRTDAGVSANIILPDSVKITDRSGADITDNYKVVLVEGRLTVEARVITVQAGNAEKEYDGTPLTCNKYEVLTTNDTALVKDHELTAVITGSQTVAGVGTNSVESVSITSGGNDVTGNYAIVCVDGTLTVHGKKITVTSASGEWVYDGLYHDDNYFECVGLLEGHEASCGKYSSFVNAGSYENEIGIKVKNADGEDVTDGYFITYICGVFTITRREVHVSTGDAEWVYDGKSHAAEAVEVDANSPYGLVEGHSFHCAQSAKITDVGEVENGFDLSVFDGVNRDRTDNYDLHITSNGTLKIKKRPVTITYKYDEIYFTGAPLNQVVTAGAYYYKSLSEYELLDGTDITATVICNEFALGAAALNFQEGSIRITDSYTGRDLTSNYEITLQSKEVEIVKRVIKLYSAEAEKVYDGDPLTCEEFKIGKNTTSKYPFIESATVPGHDIQIEASFTGSQTEIGESENLFEVTSYTVTDEDGNDLTYGYDVRKNYGTLYVTKFGSLYVETAGAQKYYDGTPLINENYTVRSTLLDGYTYEITVTGSQTEVGSSRNTFEVVVYSPDKKDVTSGLRLVSRLNWLEVLDTDINHTGGTGTGDIDLGGGIGGNGNGGLPDGGNGDDTVALRLYSGASGRVYMRAMSFGGYTGKGWSPANPYAGMIDGKYGMNYLTGFALGGAGVRSVNMRIDVKGNCYYLPYYLADGGGNRIQQSDVLYSGDTSSIYSALYYPYDYLKQGAVKITSESLTETELAYRQFVYDNYLSVPESTAEYLRTVIAAQGFDISDKNLVAKIAAFVQSSASYNLKYDKSLDGEPDAVVSFLRDYKEGVCRHYASAATLLYRVAGIPARYTVGYTGETVAGEWVEITTQNAHAWVEIYVDGMGWVQIEVTGSDESEYGEIDLGTITPADVTKAYDGTPLYANRLVEKGELARLLEEGFTYKAQFGGSQTEVGHSYSWVTGITLYDPEGKPVLKGVKWSSGNGKLTVVSGALIVVHLYYLGCEYDGRGHSLGKDDWYAEGVPAGYEIRFDPSSISVTEANGFDWEKVKALPLKLYNSSGYDVTANYNIIFSNESEEGGLGEGIDVARRQITVSTQSAEKEYDGTPLKNGEWWISFGSLAEGHSIKVNVTGSRTDAGIAPNIVGSHNVYDAKGIDVTKNYNVSFRCGTLTVID